MVGEEAKRGQAPVEEGEVELVVFCPKCGRRMSLVAAGWYCTRDDYLVDRVTVESLVE